MLKYSEFPVGHSESNPENVNVAMVPVSLMLLYPYGTYRYLYSTHLVYTPTYRINGIRRNPGIKFKSLDSTLNAKLGVNWQVLREYC